MTLSEFLLARIAEDEETAQQAEDRTWRYQLWNGDNRLFSDEDQEALAVIEYDGDAHHIARWDPARVLAGCEALREIVEMHGSSEHYPNWDGACDRPDPNGCPTLDVLATVYRDHPDYREAWT